MQQVSFATSVMMILCLLVFLDSCWNNYSVSKAILKFSAVILALFVILIATPIALITWSILEVCVFIIFGPSRYLEISEQDPEEGQDDDK